MAKLKKGKLSTSTYPVVVSDAGTLRTDERKIAPLTPSQKLENEVIKNAVQLVDPTGISNWPDVYNAKTTEERTKALVSSIIPLVGKWGKLTKIPKLAKSLTLLQKAAKSGNTIVDGIELLDPTLKKFGGNLRSKKYGYGGPWDGVEDTGGGPDEGFSSGMQDGAGELTYSSAGQGVAYSTQGMGGEGGGGDSTALGNSIVDAGIQLGSAAIIAQTNKQKNEKTGWTPDGHYRTKTGAQGIATGWSIGNKIYPGIGGIIGAFAGGAYGIWKGGKQDKEAKKEWASNNSMFRQKEQLAMQGQAYNQWSTQQGNPQTQMYRYGGALRKDYQAWRSKLPKNLQYEGDYDLEGFYNKYPDWTPENKEVHMNDEFKLPNHPTFSNESKYYNGVTPGLGGSWKGEGNDAEFVPNPKVGPPVAPVKRANGGSLRKTSSNSTEVHGPSHANGGVEVPQANAELEGGETILHEADQDYVFSEELGFAELHKKIAKSRGKIEKKPATFERLNSLRAISEKEQMLKQAQENIRSQYNLK